MIREETMNFGVVVSVRGSVVDIQFHEYLPPIYSLLDAQVGEIVITAGFVMSICSYLT